MISSPPRGGAPQGAGSRRRNGRTLPATAFPHHHGHQKDRAWTGVGGCSGSAGAASFTFAALPRFVPPRPFQSGCRTPPHRWGPRPEPTSGQLDSVLRRGFKVETTGAGASAGSVINKLGCWTCSWHVFSVCLPFAQCCWFEANRTVVTGISELHILALKNSHFECLAYYTLFIRQNSHNFSIWGWLLSAGLFFISGNVAQILYLKFEHSRRTGEIVEGEQDKMRHS